MLTARAEPSETVNFFVSDENFVHGNLGLEWVRVLCCFEFGKVYDQLVFLKKVSISPAKYQNLSILISLGPAKVCEFRSSCNHNRLPLLAVQVKSLTRLRAKLNLLVLNTLLAPKSVNKFTLLNRSEVCPGAFRRLAHLPLCLRGLASYKVIQRVHQNRV